jgi:hypothetical protein
MEKLFVRVQNRPGRNLAGSIGCLSVDDLSGCWLCAAWMEHIRRREEMNRNGFSQLRGHADGYSPVLTDGLSLQTTEIADSSQVVGLECRPRARLVRRRIHGCHPSAVG